MRASWLISITFCTLLTLSGCSTAAIIPDAETFIPTPSATPAEPQKSAVERAEIRLAQGIALAATAPNDPAALRAALDQFSIGLLVAPTDSALQAELARRQQATALLLDAMRDPAQAPQLCAEAHTAWPVATAALAVCAPQTATAAPPPVPTAPPQRSAPLQPNPAPAPTTRPQPVHFGVVERKSFEATLPSGQYNSCIDIQVVGRNGPVGGAVVGINNGEHSYQNQTDANGYTGRCGLGASTWSVVLFWTPPNQTISGAATTVWINGAAEQRAAVVFQEQ